jgi:hypothetical protein
MRQQTLAGDVARVGAVRGWHPGWIRAVAITVMAARAGSVLRLGAGRLLWRGQSSRSDSLRAQAASAGVMVMTQPGLSFCSWRIR